MTSEGVMSAVSGETRELLQIITSKQLPTADNQIS